MRTIEFLIPIFNVVRFNDTATEEVITDYSPYHGLKLKCVPFRNAISADAPLYSIVQDIGQIEVRVDSWNRAVVVATFNIARQLTSNELDQLTQLVVAEMVHGYGYNAVQNPIKGRDYINLICGWWPNTALKPELKHYFYGPWEMYAHHVENDDEEYWRSVGSDPRYVTMCDDTPEKVIVTEHPEGLYWAWLEAGNEFPCLIWHHETLFKVCFANGPEVSERHSDGHVIKVNIEPYGSK